MPLTIYTETHVRIWGLALWMVLLFVFVAGVVMYVSNRLGRKAVKA